MPTKKILTVGADGQLGKALRKLYGGERTVEFAGRAEFDLASEESFATRNWKNYSTTINAAAYTAVDVAETPAGREAAWAINVIAVAKLARAAVDHDLTLVHVSSDYVFDGSSESYTEDEPVSPLGVYGQTKAAGDAVVRVVPRHYIARMSWVIGDGNNFVRTLASLASRGVKPKAVNNQIGRLSFTDDIAAGIRHLLDIYAPYGTYNLSNARESESWADIAAGVYELGGSSRGGVTGVTAQEYFGGKYVSPRPANGVSDLTKIASAGFHPPAASERLRQFGRPL